MDFLKNLDSPIFHTISEIAEKLGRDVYVVGGYVRDIFLERHSKDIDFVTVGSGIDLASEVAKKLGPKAKLNVFPNFGTAHINYKDLELEFVGARKESYTRDSRNPIVENGTLEEDLTRRDFTINAMAISINNKNYGELLDPFHGLLDLSRGLIKTPTDPDVTFSDDPLRMLRAIRFATQLQIPEFSETSNNIEKPLDNFKLSPETLNAIKRNAPRMEIITRERINTELSKIMMAPKPSIGWKLLDETGLLPYVFPSLIPLKGVEIVGGRGHKDNFHHTIQVLDNVAVRSDNEWLRWAALLHDIAKPATKKYDPVLGWTFHSHNYVGEKMVPTIFKDMKMPLNDKMKYVAKLVGLHMRPQSVGESGVTDSGVRRLITEAGDMIEDLMLLAESDITSKKPEKVRHQLEGFKKLRERIDQINDADALRNWKNPINGREIMEKLGIPEGPCVALLKDMVKEAILEGKIPYDHDSAWNYLLENFEKDKINSENQNLYSEEVGS